MFSLSFDIIKFIKSEDFETPPTRYAFLMQPHRRNFFSEGLVKDSRIFQINASFSVDCKVFVHMKTLNELFQMWNLYGNG